MAEFGKGEIWRARVATPCNFGGNDTYLKWDETGPYYEGPVWEVSNTSVSLQMNADEDSVDIYSFRTDFRRNPDLILERVDA